MRREDGRAFVAAFLTGLAVFAALFLILAVTDYLGAR